MFIKPTVAVGTISKITKQSRTLLASQIREMEYVPKYLELAKSKDIYRFNDKEIKELTSAFGSYVTNGSKVDILKEILSIGENKGKMLTVDEIKNLLEVSSSYELKGQKNIIKFAKYVRESLVQKTPRARTIDELKKEYPYAMFKEKEISYDKKFMPSDNSASYTDAQIAKRYESFISNLYRAESDPAYLRILDMNNKKSDPLHFVSKRESALVNAIASCKEPEMLAELIELIGPTNAIKYSGDSMIKLYKMIKSPNITLLPLVSQNFYPDEIIKIVDALEKKSTKSKVIVMKNLFEKVENGKNINERRRVILTELGIQDEIVLPQIKIEYVKPLKKLDGDCGRGKRSR